MSSLTNALQPVQGVNRLNGLDISDASSSVNHMRMPNELRCDIIQDMMATFELDEMVPYTTDQCVDSGISLVETNYTITPIKSQQSKDFGNNGPILGRFPDSSSGPKISSPINDRHTENCIPQSRSCATGNFLSHSL